MSASIAGKPWADSLQAGTQWAHLLVLSVTIFALYSSSLTSVYLFADETYAFSETLVDRDVATGAMINGRISGRPIHGAAQPLLAQAILLGEAGLQLLRLLQFAISLAAAIYVFFVMRALRIEPDHALLLTIFIWSQPAVAIHHAYVYLVDYWLGIFCSLLAFSIFLARKHKSFGWRESALYSVLFGVGLLTFQATPFFFLGFLAFDVLNDRDGVYWRRHARLFLILIGTVALYTATFKLAFELLAAGACPQTQQLLSLTDSTGFFSGRYLFVFEFWNYLIPVEISEATKWRLLLATAVSWVSLVTLAVVADARKQTGNLKRWALAIACTGACFLPVLADRATGRQHLFLAVLPALVLLAYHAGTRVVPRHGIRGIRWTRWTKPVLVACLGLIVAGGSLGYQRALVGPAARLFSFVQTEALDQMHPGVRRVIVIRPHGGEIRGLCRYEPCTSFFGRRVATPWHLDQIALYQTAMRLVDLPPRLPVEIVAQVRTLQDDAITIDLNRFLQVEKRRGS